MKHPEEGSAQPMNHPEEGSAPGALVLVRPPTAMESDAADSLRAAVARFLGPDVPVGLSEPAATASEDGSVDAPRTIREAGWPRGTVVVVPGHLRTRLLQNVGGWTDRRRGVAIVSTTGLDLADARHRERLAKLVAHEATHVVGLGHCRRSGCLARPCRSPEELDALDGFCTRCRWRLDAAARRARRGVPQEGPDTSG
jgi:peptidase M54-like protein